MEQEVSVTIHGSTTEDHPENSEHKSCISDQITRIGETFSDAFLSFRESEPGAFVQQGAVKAKEYIKKNPTQAMLLSLGAGALFGLLLKKKR
jgi:ElaB/YqjD/DUF883 family membrane-anchored ribosome-binding protein